MNFLTNVRGYFGAEVLVVPSNIFSSCVSFAFKLWVKMWLNCSRSSLGFLGMVALRIKTIIYCVKCLDNHWFISALLTDCGGLPSLVQGLNVLEIGCCVQRNCHSKKKAKDKKHTLG